MHVSHLKLTIDLLITLSEEENKHFSQNVKILGMTGQGKANMQKHTPVTEDAQ